MVQVVSNQLLLGDLLAVRESGSFVGYRHLLCWGFLLASRVTDQHSACMCDSILRAVQTNE